MPQGGPPLPPATGPIVHRSSLSIRLPHASGVPCRSPGRRPGRAARAPQPDPRRVDAGTAPAVRGEAARATRGVPAA
ncbi:hypothetical protein NKH77_50180 [Streptomyces sp. M19]